MKFLKFAVLAIFASLFFNQAFAEEDKPSLPTLTNVKYIKDEIPRTLSPSSFPNGIYVECIRDASFLNSAAEFPKVADLLKETLIRHGFVIAKSRDSADIILRVNNSYNLSFDEIESSKTESTGRVLSKLDNIGGILLGAKLMGSDYIAQNGVKFNASNKKAVGLGVTSIEKDGSSKESYLSSMAYFSEDTYITSEQIVLGLLDVIITEHLTH